MDRVEQQYYTIGDVAKIMGQHPQSIRYYERLGIIRPALVDPETGYRYYTPAQLGIFSAIHLHTRLGMPLRDFSRYCRNGACYAGQFFREAADRIRQKITELEQHLSFIRQMEQIISHGDALLASPEGFRADFPDKLYIAAPISPELSTHELFFVLHRLRLRSEAAGLQPMLPFGKIAIYKKGQPVRLYAVQQVSADCEGETILRLPQGEYACTHTKDSAILNAETLFPREFATGTTQLVFEAPLITSVHSTQTPQFAVRCRSL